MKLRIKFSKHGVLKFIGHLDVMRYFQKAVRRAGIDIAYSAGFSPHQIMSFAAPLGVGLESNGEYMDIEVNSLTSAKEFVNALNAQMADGIQILEARLLPDNAQNAMASVAAAKYTIAFRDGYLPSFLCTWAPKGRLSAELTGAQRASRGKSSLLDCTGEESPGQAVAAFFSQKEIIVTKKTKKGESTFNMKPYIYACSYDEASASLSLTVDASSAGNIKPSLVMKALYAYHHTEFDESGLFITREETYLNAGTEDAVRLEPLGFVGSDY